MVGMHTARCGGIDLYSPMFNDGLGSSSGARLAEWCPVLMIWGWQCIVVAWVALLAHV